MEFVSQTTKRALEASLKKLLLQKPLNKITINDITEDCGVNRMTFYYHFKDIYDLVDWIMVEDAAKALENKPTFDTWTEAFLDILHQVQENKVLVMNVYRSISREQVEQYFHPYPAAPRALLFVVAGLPAGEVRILPFIIYLFPRTICKQKIQIQGKFSVTIAPYCEILHRLCCHSSPFSETFFLRQALPS